MGSRKFNIIECGINRHCQMLLGEITHVLFLMLAVELPALVVTYWIRKFLLCPLLPRMSMKHKFNLRLNVEFLQFQQLWGPKGFHFQAMFLIWFTVLAAGCLGISKVECLTTFCLSRKVTMVHLIYFCCFADGKLLLELNRVLRPGGYFVWSATPVYSKRAEDKSIWKG